MGADEWVHDVDSDLVNIIRELNKGFRPKHVTTSQRATLTHLFDGLIVFNSTTNKLNVYLDSGWQEITSA